MVRLRCAGPCLTLSLCQVSARQRTVFLLRFPVFVLCFCALSLIHRESAGVRIALEGQARACASPIPQMRELRFREEKSPAQRLHY